MDSLKSWLVEVGYKKIAPALIKGALAALVGLIAAHQQLMNNIGVGYDAVQETIVIHLKVLSGWMIVVGGASVMGLFTAIQHHTVAAVTGQPQSGDPTKETRRANDVSNAS